MTRGGTRVGGGGRAFYYAYKYSENMNSCAGAQAELVGVLGYTGRVSKVLDGVQMVCRWCADGLVALTALHYCNKIVMMTWCSKS